MHRRQAPPRPEENAARPSTNNHPQERRQTYRSQGHMHNTQSGISRSISDNRLQPIPRATIQTLHKHLTEVSHRHQNQIANTIDTLSQATQALLQALDLVQPSTPWNTDERQNTMVFTPTEVDYNPLRLQAQSHVIFLQDPRSINLTIKFSIKPPRIRSYTRGDEAWKPW